MVCMLQTRLATTESMTRDVIRDLLGVKLDITNYAPELNRPKRNREISGGSSSTERRVLCKEKLLSLEHVEKSEAIANEEMYKTSQEFNNRLLQHNSCLPSNLETTNEAHKRLETEKSSIVEHLSTVRGHNKTLQEQLASLKCL
ncbi:kinesin protein KIN-14C [Trifolium repens]|nr:kinesin protein KIN-14C [Trifolium repens]